MVTVPRNVQELFFGSGQERPHTYSSYQTKIAVSMKQLGRSRYYIFCRILRHLRDSRMAFKVQVGPAQIAIHQGQTVLLTETDGRVNWPSKSGLYFRDTRVI